MSRKRWIWDNWFKPRNQWPPYYGPDLAKVKRFLTHNKHTKMKEFSILIAEDASYDEIVDSIADVFGIGITIENALKDGFQLSDLLTAVSLEPTVREVINDFPVFLAQFRALNGTTAIQAVEQAKTRTIAAYGALGKVSAFIYGFLQETSYTYKFIQDSIIDGSERLNAWKGLFDTVNA